MMLPLFCFSITGSTCFMPKNTPTTLTSSTFRNVSSEYSGIDLTSPSMPALLWNTSMLPNLSVAAGRGVTGGGGGGLRGKILCGGGGGRGGGRTPPSPRRIRRVNPLASRAADNAVPPYNGHKPDSPIEAARHVSSHCPDRFCGTRFRHDSPTYAAGTRADRQYLFRAGAAPARQHPARQ